MNASLGGNSGQVQVPKVTGEELGAATSQLGQVGLVAAPEMTGLDPNAGPWKIGEQQPKAGEWVDPGSHVILKALSPTV